MRILWNNLLDVGEVTATNVNAAYPVSNLTYATQRSRTLLALFKTTTNTTTITCVFDSVQTLNGFAIGNHNAAQLSITLKDSAGSVMATETFVYADLVTAYSNCKLVSLSTSYTGVKTVEVNVSSTQSEIYIGGLYIGQIIDLAPADAFQPMTLKSLGKNDLTDQGVISGRGGALLESFSWPMSGVSRATLDSYIPAYDYCQTSRPFFIDPHPGTNLRHLFARFANDSVTGEVYEGGDYTVSVSFEEVR